MTEPRVLTLLGADGCHLCHAMADVVRSVAPALGFTLDERNVRERAEWQSFRLEIPVLLADGREVARHRIEPAELERRLRELADQGRGAAEGGAVEGGTSEGDAAEGGAVDGDGPAGKDVSEP